METFAPAYFDYMSSAVTANVRFDISFLACSHSRDVSGRLSWPKSLAASRSHSKRVAKTKDLVRLGRPR
jgi:hypothetical protein